ncbi:unnamed protein product [Hymenolepis diminuta]|uniref:Uncharacterized protein n=1 Tax=Hymenolepis diminuta TaxID=6216 RepID=A0A564XYS0_HYMDI|nr:unnamed protein product [Hymenolepis diminuta]
MKYIETLFVVALCLAILTRGQAIDPENPYYKNAYNRDTGDSVESDPKPPESGGSEVKPPNGDSSVGTPSKPGEAEKPGSDADTEGKTSESGGGSVTTVTTTSKGTSLSLVFPLLTLLSSLSFIFSNS